MNLKIIKIMLLSLSLFAIAGCAGIDLSNVDLSNISEEDINKFIVCEEPYMRHGTGCCLDTDGNKICDQDEGISNSQGLPQFTNGEVYNEDNWQTRPNDDEMEKYDRKFVSGAELNDEEIAFLKEIEAEMANEDDSKCFTLEETTTGTLSECKTDTFSCLAKDSANFLNVACEKIETGMVCGIEETPSGVRKNCLRGDTTDWRLEFSKNRPQEDDFKQQENNLKPCTREYRPVCATMPDGMQATFPNKCEFENSNGKFMHEGECKYEHEDNFNNYQKDDCEHQGGKWYIDYSSTGTIEDEYCIYEHKEDNSGKNYDEEDLCIIEGNYWIKYNDVESCYSNLDEIKEKCSLDGGEFRDKDDNEYECKIEDSKSNEDENEDESKESETKDDETTNKDSTNQTLTSQ